ncbi:MAG: helix-turn-helix domain-containing protein [Mycobacterium sp.]
MESILTGTNVCIILADRDVRLVDLRPGTPIIGDAIGENGAVLGNLFSEESSGTNSVATVHELRTPLSVFGDQHYLESMKKFSCYGYPVIHPLTHRLEGVLDLTFFVDEDNPLLHPMIKHAARDIEAQLLQQSPRDEQTLIEMYQRVSARRRGAPMVGVAGDLVLANSAATALLDAVDYAALGTFTAEAPLASHTLSSGARVSLRLTRATPGAGIVFEINPHETGVPRARSDAKGRSRSRVERVENQIADARAHRRSLSVVGERGTGRSAALMRLMADADPMVFDGIDRVHEPENAWLQRVTHALDEATRPVIIENAHLLSPPAARATRAALDGTSAWFALSSDPLNLLSPEVFALIDSSAVRLALLPLRLRKHEIPTLVQAILTELSSTARFTPAALRTLLAHDWPGNDSELRAEVTAAARRRSAGDIADGDLIRLKDRAAGPMLNAIDTALRATVEEALATHAGNKLATARSLGISRTTLYKHMRAFGLSV